MKKYCVTIVLSRCVYSSKIRHKLAFLSWAKSGQSSQTQSTCACRCRKLTARNLIFHTQTYVNLYTCAGNCTRISEDNYKIAFEFTSNANMIRNMFCQQLRKRNSICICMCAIYADTTYSLQWSEGTVEENFDIWLFSFLIVFRTVQI